MDNKLWGKATRRTIILHFNLTQFGLCVCDVLMIELLAKLSAKLYLIIDGI